MIAATIAPADARERRPRARRDAGLDARADRRRGDDPRRRGAARVRSGSAVEAHPDRLHERPRAHDPRGPAAEALRVLGRRERSDRRGEGVPSGGEQRRYRQRRARRRRLVADPDHRVATMGAEAARGPDRRGDIHRRSERVRARGPRRLGGGDTTAGVSALRHPTRLASRHRQAHPRRPGHRARGARRHHLHVIGVRRAERPAGPRRARR